MSGVRQGNLARNPFATPKPGGALPGLAGFGSRQAPGMGGAHAAAPEPRRAVPQPPPRYRDEPEPAQPRPRHGADPEPTQAPSRHAHPVEPSPALQRHADAPSTASPRAVSAFAAHEEGHASHPSQASKAARAAYDEIAERSRGALGSSLPGRFAPAAAAGNDEFERQPDARGNGHRAADPEPSVDDFDAFAADELKRYLETETGEPAEEPFAESAHYDDGQARFGHAEETEPFAASVEAPEPEAESEYGLDRYEARTDGTDYDRPTAAFQGYADDAEPESETDFGNDFGQDTYSQADETFGLGDDADSRQVQPFEARYDQHPEVPIGAMPPRQGGRGASDFDEQFFSDDHGDADFGADGMASAPAGGRKGRKRMLMAGAGVGALALVLAGVFAFQGGGTPTAGTAQPPLITADQRPVKSVPEDPGGKQFPNRNKQIYDRLQGEERAEQERLLPRQEDVVGGLAAAPAAQQPAAGVPGGVSVTEPDATAAAEPARRVRTFVVLPDGSVVRPEEAPSQVAARNLEQQPASIPGLSVLPPGATPAQAPAEQPPRPAAGAAAPPQQAAAQQQQAAAARQQAQPPQQVAARPVETAPMPEQRPAPPAPQQQAARPPAVATDANGNFVVQVAARRSQTDALAAFADLQQRYPSLLNNYRPIIERADLGQRGVWYRLRVGPMETRTVAANLCERLQAAGMKECLVYQQ